jgi:hypothetical protein
MDKWTEGEATQPNEKEEREKKPSRLWMLYHFWAGFCLKLSFDASGFSQFVLGPLSGSDPESASSYAGSSAILAVSSVALGYVLSKALVNAVDRYKISKNANIFLKSIFPIVYLAGAILLSVVTSPLFAASQDDPKTFRSNEQYTELKPVVAATTAQTSEGLTEADLSQAVLEKLENWMVETMLKKGMNAYSEMGYNPQDFKPKISADSVYMVVRGRKLAVIRINMDNAARSVTIMGIKGSELLRVSCIRSSNRDIPVWSGECGNEVQKTFGVSIQP